MRTTLAAMLALLLFPACGDDTSDFEPWILETLEPDQGFYFRTPEFDVAAGEETQDCYFVEVPDINDGGEIWVDKTVTAINPGSHHMNVFRVNTIVNLDPADGVPVDAEGLDATVIRGGECWKAPNWADWPLVANSQKSAPDDPVTEWQLPDGVAHKFMPGEQLMIQSHYVNATTQVAPFRGKVGINFYKTDETDPIELGTMFATQQSIRICQSQPQVSYSGTCAFPEASDITITAANGHFHSRGTQFQVFSWDGTSETQPPLSDRFYVSDTWDDPPMMTGMDLPVQSGGGIWWTCDYQWTEPPTGCDKVNERDPQMADDCCYTFGPIVEYSEHCNVFAYYYPKIDRSSILCN